VPSGASWQLPLRRACCRLSPPPPPRGSPSLAPSSPASRSAHTGAPARGRAGGGGHCCRCRSPSLSRSRSRNRGDRPPCCESCGRLLLSFWPQPSSASRQSSGREEDKERRGAAGWSELGSEQGVPAPAVGKRQPGSLARSLCALASAEGTRQRDAAALLLGGARLRLPAAAWCAPVPIAPASTLSIPEDARGCPSPSEHEVRSVPLPTPQSY
jgi:hypothetical protein